MKHIPLRVLALVLPLMVSPLRAGEADAALLKAAAAGDAPQIVLALAEASPDARDAQGRTPLMFAAQSGDFESVRRLLWGGATANLKDDAGKTARDYVKLDAEGSAPLLLMIRCYVFCQEQARPGGKARVPELALINDFWVDPFHPKLKPFYYVNEVELKGRNGADDDNNGFIDDVYGWNLWNDIPLVAPQMAVDGSPETQAFLELLMKDLRKVYQGDQQTKSILENRYNNPLVRQIGLGNLQHVGIKLHDLNYALMLDEASHGTHVAGIITQYSGGKARIHAADIGVNTPRAANIIENYPALAALAERTDDYGKFVDAAITEFRASRMKKGRLASDYLRAIGAGIANMSWGIDNSASESYAAKLEEVYKLHGKNPDSIATASKGPYALQVANLALEVRIADAASFALVFYENPDVFITIAASNDNLPNDHSAAANDVNLRSPQYLSRFFPNVMTVASISEKGALSVFSNFGNRSVQIAALGEDIVAPILNNMEAPKSGTSMAAPLVAGVAAGIRKDHPDLSASDIRRILEMTVTVDPALAPFVATSGKINPAAAARLAASWSGDNVAVLAQEAFAAKKPGPDGPTYIVPKLESKPAPVKLPKLSDIGDFKFSDQSSPFRITNVTGFKSDWRVVVSRNSPYTDQRQLGVGPWPQKEVEKGWKDGFHISSIGGDADGWNVIMSTGKKVRQQVLGYAFDQTAIAKHMDSGLRITHIAGWGENWLTVLESDTGWGAQRYTLPTVFSPSRQKWIKERWDEGYRITAVAGDDFPNVDDDGWLFVMTQGTSIQDQIYTLPGPWPASWIQENLAKGLRVTSVAGSGDRTIVVMSKGSGLGDQQVSDGGTYPNEWIGKKWNEK